MMTDDGSKELKLPVIEGEPLKLQAGPPKPGWASTEFYKSLGFVIFLAVTALSALNLEQGHWAVKLGAVLAALLAAGWTVTNYTTNRTKAKK